MVTGGVTSHIEQIYAEGMGLLSGDDIDYRHYMYSRNRPSITQYAIDSEIFGPHRVGAVPLGKKRGVGITGGQRVNVRWVSLGSSVQSIRNSDF